MESFLFISIMKWYVRVRVDMCLRVCDDAHFVSKHTYCLVSLSPVRLWLPSYVFTQAYYFLEIKIGLEFFSSMKEAIFKDTKLAIKNRKFVAKRNFIFLYES